MYFFLYDNVLVSFFVSFTWRDNTVTWLKFFTKTLDTLDFHGESGHLEETASSKQRDAVGQESMQQLKCLHLLLESVMGNIDPKLGAEPYPEKKSLLGCWGKEDTRKYNYYVLSFIITFLKGLCYSSVWPECTLPSALQPTYII